MHELDRAHYGRGQQQSGVPTPTICHDCLVLFQRSYSATSLQKNGASSESDEQLRQRFEKDILPKIKEQLKGLDQNEQPNTATIELKRQLRVGFQMRVL